MELSRTHFKQFLQTKECEELIEKIVSIYSTSLLKKIQKIEEQLEQFCGKSKENSPKIISCCQPKNTGWTTEDLEGGTEENDPKKNEEKATQTDKNSSSSRLNSICSDDGLSGDGVIGTHNEQKCNKPENIFFEKCNYIESIELPKHEYSDNLLLGVLRKNVKNQKLVFECRGKRFWIHLDNCKPRSRRERIIQTQLEQILRSKYEMHRTVFSPTKNKK